MLHFMNVERLRGSNRRDNDEDIDIKNIEIVSVLKSDGNSLQHPKNLLYYINPTVSESSPMDLNLGFKEHIFRKPELEERAFNKVEDYLMHQLKDGQNESAAMSFLKNIDICATRGVFQIIMAMPFQNMPRRQQLIATKFKGKIFLSIKGPVWPNNGKAKPRDTYQFKFRQYIFASTPHGKPNTDAPVNENEQLFATYHAKLGNLNLLYSAEISGVMNQDEITDLTNRKQLKTCKVITPKICPPSPNWRKDIRLFKWITQAHLIGAQDFCVAIQDKKSGVIRSPIQHFHSDYLAELQSVKPRECMPFVHKFLVKLKSLMAEVDSPYTAFAFEWDKEKSSVVYKIYEGKSEYSRLSEEFIEFMRTQMQ